MVSEQQAGKELMVRNLSFGHFEELDKIHSALKEVGVLPGQVVQLIEAMTELKDADFRTAAFSSLELKKITGKSYKQAEAYIQSLGVEITSKEKQNSEWTGKIEKAKDEFRAWEQKRKAEKASFNFAQAQNKRILKEDGEKLNLELKKNNVTRTNIEWTIWLTAELKKIGMDLPMFKSIVRETVLKGGITSHIAKAIKAAVKTFGSLGKAITEREKDEKARRKVIRNLSKEERKKEELLRVFDKSIALKHEKSTELSKHLDSSTKLLLEWGEQIEQNKWQWEFFQVFISMLLVSPSAPDSLVALGLKLQELHEKGWTHSGELTLPEQRRALFIFLVLGTYLHSVHCSNCGASFIVNKAYNANNQFKQSYNCPVCSFTFSTKPDGTFLELMLSPELPKKLQDARTLLDTIEKTDMETLGRKLKLLDSIPNEVFEAFSVGHKVQVKVLDAAD